MKTLPERSKVIRCMRCREPITQLIRVDGQGATHCAQCAPPRHNRVDRIDLIRAAALAARAERTRVLIPLPKSGRRHV